MSIIGTGIAASVANAHVGSSQAAKSIKKESAQRAFQSQKIKDVFESHLKGIEEGQEDDASDRIHIDGKVPDHGHPPQQEKETKEETKAKQKTANPSDDMLKQISGGPRHWPYTQAEPPAKFDVQG